MNRRIDRRDFGIQASAAIGGLASGAVLGEGRLIAQDRDPAEKRLVLLGLNALARAHEMNYFNDGHRGAAMVSAYLLCVDNDLDDQATARIVELFDLNWSTTKLCQPFPEGDPIPKGLEDRRGPCRRKWRASSGGARRDLCDVGDQGISHDAGSRNTGAGRRCV